MNDDELRAFLESATVEEDTTATPARAETSQSSTPAAAANPSVARASEGQPVASPAPGAPGMSFEDLIGSKRPAAQPVEPLVLPSPKQNSSDPNLTPLQLPEPRRPYQVAPTLDTPTAAAPIRATPTSAIGAPDADFPPTEPIQRADVPVPPVAPVPTAPVAAQSRRDVRIAPVPPAPLPTSRERDYEPIEVTGGAAMPKRWLPWAIVGGGAAIALIASFVVVGAVTGGSNEEQVANLPATTEAPVVETPREPVEDTTASEPEPVVAEEEEDDSKPPVVEVGPTMTLPVSQWAVTAELSSRFGQTFYSINTPDQLVLNSALIDSLPASCEAMRQQWGILRVDGNKYEVLKPADKCAAAPELYDELWGLTAAMVATVTPQ